MRIKDLFSAFFLVSIMLTLPVDYKVILKREVNGILCSIPYAANVKG